MRKFLKHIASIILVSTTLIGGADFSLPVVEAESAMLLETLSIMRQADAREKLLQERLDAYYEKQKWLAELEQQKTLKPSDNVITLNTLSMINKFENEVVVPEYNSAYHEFWNDILQAYHSGEYKNYYRDDYAYVYPVVKDYEFIQGFLAYVRASGIPEFRYASVYMTTYKEMRRSILIKQEIEEKDKIEQGDLWKPNPEYDKYKVNGEWLNLELDEAVLFINFDDFENKFYESKKIEQNLKSQKEKLQNIVNEIGLSTNTTERDAVIKINNYVCNLIEYDYSLTRFSLDAALSGNCVCNGYSLLFHSLCLSVGLESKYIMGGCSAGVLHAWNSILIDGNWYYVDSTWNDAIGQNWLLISCEQMSKDHYQQYEVSTYLENEYKYTEDTYHFFYF